MKKRVSIYPHTNQFTNFLTYVHNNARKTMITYRQFSELHKIMSHNRLTTFFQPIMNLQDGSCLGYEILNRPPLSSSFPSTESFYEFIGHTDQVFAFERFCREISIERFRASFPVDRDPKEAVVFLNVHPQVLADSHYRSGETVNLLHVHGLSPEQVVLELTEKQAVHDYLEFERILSNYRAQGFRIAIDDVGSGYSSLKAIISLKPDFIKLDRALIRYADVHSDQQHLVRLLKEFAAGSGTYIVAEGIERDEEIEFLRSEGIDYGQGYALGRPDPQLKFPKLEFGQAGLRNTDKSN
ncbi:EAL domain-containing protein [Paenibacillus massiliensis]|uniref:EAL domain-containing protein n=1 Tax=Paenibacillus massiliensis TaxID=225917 RepID=UPI00036C387F|nr:EAL domain-containing protein [Paenibacillus massiliensis]